MSRNLFGQDRKDETMPRYFGLRPKTPAQHLIDRNADLLMPTWPAWVAVGLIVALAGWMILFA